MAQRYRPTTRRNYAQSRDFPGNRPYTRPSPFCWRAKLALRHKGLLWTLRHREARLGMTLEELRDLAPSKVPAAQSSFLPLRRWLQDQPFLCGDAPAYADYIA